MAAEAEELCPRAEIFRSKLIEDFQLLDTINTRGEEEAIPKYYSNEISGDDNILNKMLRECPQGLIKFQVYVKKDEFLTQNRNLNRIRDQNRIPFGPWAAKIIENSYVQNFMMFLIITNSIILGVQSELSQSTDESLAGFKMVLAIFDYCTLMFFGLEIIIKWIAGFWEFWKNGWNIFDFFVTVMSFVPEVIKLASGENSTKQVAVVAENLRVFRILRSLKMVSRFAQLRIIVLTILKAFKSMAFILMLLTVTMYIFAVAGKVLFVSHATSQRKDIKYKQSFSSLDKALITLFQLFTLDHWYEVLNDLLKVSNAISAKLYVILWICIGAFVFRNIFAGIMVMNFQNIRNDVNQQVREQVNLAAAMQKRLNLVEELENKDKMLSRSRRSSTFSNANMLSREASKEATVIHSEPIQEHGEHQVPQIFVEGNDDDNEQSLHNLGSSRLNVMGMQSSSEKNINQDSASSIPRNRSFRHMSKDWNDTVAANLSHIANNPVETLWPRDTLFRYFRLMEKLQENLMERQQLIRLAVQAQWQLHDSKPN